MCVYIGIKRQGIWKKKEKANKKQRKKGYETIYRAERVRCRPVMAKRGKTKKKDRQARGGQSERKKGGTDGERKESRRGGKKKGCTDAARRKGKEEGGRGKGDEMPIRV